MYKDYRGNIGKYNDLKCREKRKAHICECSADSTGQAGMLDKLFFFIGITESCFQIEKSRDIKFRYGLLYSQVYNKAAFNISADNGT